MNNDVVIIGGGLAGLTAGLYAARSGLRTLVLEHMMPGGQVANLAHIKTYPGFPEGVAGYDLGPNAQAQAEEAGAEFAMQTVVGLEQADGGYVVRCDGAEYTTRSVIIAAGSSLRQLGVPGETEFAGRGVSTCASCDGYFFVGKHVVVVGGGDSALEDALELAEMGVERITLVHRGGEFSAQQVLVDRVLQSSIIEPVFGTELTAIEGEGTVNQVVLNQGGNSRTLAADGVFIFAGLVPNTEWLGNAVELDAGGHVVVDPHLMTSLPGVFAAGDIRQNSAAQLIASAGDGASAAVFAARHLADTASSTLGRNAQPVAGS